MNRHVQKTIYVVDNGKRKRIVCDELMVPLVKLLWKSGFKTTYSCQGNMGDKRVTDVPYITIKDCEKPGSAEQIIKDFWKCPVERREFLDGYAFYALPTKRIENLWKRCHC